MRDLKNANNNFNKGSFKIFRSITILAGRAGCAASIGAFGSNRGKKSLEQISKKFTASTLGIGRTSSSGIFLIIPVKPVFISNALTLVFPPNRLDNWSLSNP
jgi:hypothetical protein